ncbi:MAG TPA: hypothetical protein VGD72_08370 [Mycobacteriales bacterium]
MRTRGLHLLVACATPSRLLVAAVLMLVLTTLATAVQPRLAAHDLPAWIVDGTTVLGWVAGASVPFLLAAAAIRWLTRTPDG